MARIHGQMERGVSPPAKNYSQPLAAQMHHKKVDTANQPTPAAYFFSPNGDAS
jgi:hypothetical protein